MINIKIYRYADPWNEGKWLYCGIGLDRDDDHANGKSDFAKWFQRHRPRAILPNPVERWIKVPSRLHAELEESADMIEYQTHCDFGGANLVYSVSNLSLVLKVLIKRREKKHEQENETYTRTKNGNSSSS